MLNKKQTKEFRDKLRGIEGDILNVADGSDDLLDMQVKSIGMNVQDAINEAYRLIHYTQLFLEE